MKRKLMSLLLCACMTLTMVPMSAFATDVETTVETNSVADNGDTTNVQDKDEAAKCICKSKCSEDAANTECAVCRENFADCAFEGEATKEPTKEPGKVSAEESVEKMAETTGLDVNDSTTRNVATEDELRDAVANASEDEAKPTVINMNDDIYLSSMLTVGERKFVSINGNGHTISRNEWDIASNPNILQVEGSVYIENCTLDADGCTHVLLVKGGQLEAKDTNFTGANNATSYGAIGINNAGSMVMTGGSIYENESKDRTAVVADGGNFDMTNAKIYNNICHGGNGGVLLFAIYDKSASGGICGTITLKSGEIYNNQNLLNQTADGSYPASSDVNAVIPTYATFKISGSVYVHGNTVSVDNGDSMPRDYACTEGNAGHRDAKGNYISSLGVQLTSPLEHDVTVTVMEYNEDTIDRRTLFRGADGYTLTKDDLDKVEITIGKYFANNKTYSKDDLCVCLNKEENTIEACAAAEVTLVNIGDTSKINIPKYVKSELADPAERTGYAFDGWYNNSELTGDKVTTPVAGNTYYAKWIATSGTCGDPEVNEGKDVTWALTQNNEDNENPTYTLTISGTGAMADYSNESKTPWYGSGVVQKIVVNDGVTSVGNCTARYMSSLNKVVLADSVEKIGGQAFQQCTSLTEFNFPNSLTTIGGFAFANSAITTADLSKCAKLGTFERAFQNSSLSSVKLPSNLKSISPHSFNGSKLTSVELPKGLLTIGENAFASAPLSSIKIPESVTSIGKSAFAYTKIASVIIPSGVATIEDSIFFNVASLSSVVLPGTVSSIGNTAFSTSNLTIYISNVTDYDNCAVKTALTNSGYAEKPIAITNGGTFTDDTAFEASKLATPTKDNYIFGGWYDNAKFSGDAVTTATAGKIYYAKWKALAITLDDKTGENALTYDGTAKPLTATLENTPDAAFTYTYALRTSTEGEGTYGEVTATAPTNAGYYKVVATLGGTDRTATAYLEIKPADITAATKTVNVKQGDTTPQQLDLSTLELTPNLSTIGTVAYSVKITQDTDGILDGKPTLADDKLKFKLKEVVDATHSATVEVTVTPESPNYNPVTVTVQISITKDTVAPTMSASPTSGTETVIGLQDKIKVTFSKKMIGTPTVAVSGGEGTANGVLAKDGLSMVITPADLANGTTYTFTVNDLTDVAGNALTNNTLTYTTLRQPETSGTAVPTITGEETIITGNADAVPANVTIDYTTEVTTADQAKLKAAGNLPDGYSKTDVFFELVLKVNGVAVKDAVLNRAISITIPYSVEKDTEYKIAHLKADGSVEILDATADIAAQTLTFSVKSLSPFMVLSKYNAPASLDTSDKGAKTDTSNKKAKLNTPNTGDSSNTALWMSLLLISSGALAAFGIYRKRKKENR